jgi:pimeloyl-ACP methyl ester carboxylesterase
MLGRPPTRLFLIAACLLVLVSCRGDLPEALEVNCADAIEDRQTDISCFTVAVPADYSEPDGADFEVFVVVVDNPGGEDVGPVAGLVGGPGQAAHSFLERMRGQPFDVVLVDQRGTGLSKPSLHCSELDEIRTHLLALGHTTDADAIVAGALAECGVRLANAGVDVSLFDTDSNARDFDIVRAALGYDQWNLWGDSYGSRLGLEILRLHPETVRAAVFGSISPPQADLAAEWPDHHRRAVDLLIESCAASTDCYEAFGDLRALINELVEGLDTSPVDVEVLGSTVRMDGAALARTVFEALYSTRHIRELPFLLSTAADGDLVRLAEIRARNYDPTFSWGMYWSVHCRDYYSVTDYDAMTAALADETGGFAKAFDYTGLIETCRQWGAGTSPPSAREPVNSDIPTLLLAGRYDPATPPVWAHLVAQGLTHSTYIEFARFGHGPSMELCGLKAVEDYFRDPSRAPNIACDPAEPPRWLLP